MHSGPKVSSLWPIYSDYRLNVKDLYISSRAPRQQRWIYDRSDYIDQYLSVSLRLID